MAAEEGQVEAAVEEEVLWQETPVDGPLEEELPLQLKGAVKVGGGVGEEEGCTQDKLWGEGRQRENDRGLRVC